jgi:CRISPR-associated protein Cas8a1/Csx13
MAKELIYRLGNPGYTIYHRAALGGLAATVRAWGANKPEGIEADLQRDFVRLAWGDNLSDQEALLRILDASFKLTEDKMIELPGHGIRDDQVDLRLAIHNGLKDTFLQHPQSCKTEKQISTIRIKSVDDEGDGELFTYKPITSYAHQPSHKALAIKGRLLDAKYRGHLPAAVAVPQWMVPGIQAGAHEIEISSEEAVLLLFLLTSCPVFHLRPRNYKEKAQYCVLFPDVTDLKKFALALVRATQADPSIMKFTNSYLGRIAGGLEEAALKFMIDLKAGDIASEPSISGCLVVAMGEVSWDNKQNNRSLIVKLKDDYPEIDIFYAANQHLSQAKIIKLKKGEGFAIPTSPLPELIAANLTAERHWCANFKSLVSDKKAFERMKFSHGGLKAMKEAIKDADDQAIIRAFQEAWKRTMAALGDRARRDGSDFGRLVEVERERTRNAILRAKTAEALASWFLRFCADATKGAALAAIREDAQRIQRFIFNQRNFDRFHNLCLFALVSYASDESNPANRGNQ